MNRFAIGIVGDAGVRGSAQQPRLFVGMILILIFAEVLGTLDFASLYSVAMLMRNLERSLWTHRCSTHECKSHSGRPMLNDHLSPRAGSEATTLRYTSLLPRKPRNLSSPSCMKKAPGMDIYGCSVLVEIEGRHNRERRRWTPFSVFPR